MKTNKMIKAIIYGIPFLITATINAQNFTGKAVYKTSQKSTINFDNNDGMTDKMKEELKARMQKMNQKTFILEFDKTSSTYKQEAKLAAPNPKVGGTFISTVSFGGSGNGSIYYKNIQEKRYANQTEIQGKRFLIKDALPAHQWELSSETKNIGKYTCYKATFTKEVDKINMTMVDGELKEEKKKETIVTTAWYTPQVPLSNGPANYQGLPGLILEINDGKRLIVCTEIILNPSNKIIVDEPEKGKVVSQSEFNVIQKKKTDEMMEKFSSRNGVDMGNGINVRMIKN